MSDEILPWFILRALFYKLSNIRWHYKMTDYFIEAKLFKPKSDSWKHKR